MKTPKLSTCYGLPTEKKTFFFVDVDVVQPQEKKIND